MEGTLSTPEVGKARERVDGGNGQKTQVREIDFSAPRCRCVERAFSSSARVCLHYCRQNVYVHRARSQFSATGGPDLQIDC